MYGIEKQIKSAGSESILFAHKASMLLDEKSTEEALSLCEEGVKFFPFYAEGHFVLAKCYHSKGKLDDAKREYEKVLHYLPGHLKALKALAYIYFKHQQDSEAQAVLQNFVLYDPLNGELIEFLKSKGYYKELTQPAAETAEPESLEIPEPAETGVQDEKTYSAEDILSSEFDTEADPDVEQPEVQVYDEVPVLNLDGDDADVPYDAEAFKEDLPEDAAIPPSVFLTDKDDVDEETRQDQYEINNIVDTIDEKQQEDTNVNLDDFSNTKDDFSTIIEDVFDKPADDEQKDDLPEPEISENGENQEADPDAEVEAEERPMLDTTIIFNEQRSGDQDDTVEDEIPAGSFEQIEAGIEKDSSAKADEIEAGMAEMMTAEIDEDSPETIELDADTQSPPETGGILSDLDAAMDVPEDDETEKPAESGEQIEISVDAEEPEIIPASEISGEAAPAAEEIIEDTAEISPAPAEEKTTLPDDEHVDIEDILSNPSLLTPTFGEILIAQRKFDDARQVFLELSKRQPDDERIKKKIIFLEKIVAADKNK